MQAKINGELVVFDSAFGTGYFVDHLKCYQIYSIMGISDFDESYGHSIQLNFDPSNGLEVSFNPLAYYETFIGDKSIRENTISYDQLYWAYDSEGRLVPFDLEGSITITSNSNSIYKGTFHFNAAIVRSAFENSLPEKVEVTDGEFEISFLPKPCE